MRHRRAGVHLSRTSAHRKALFSNLVAALFTNERIRTTDAKAKETRRLAERTITWARRVGDVLTKKPDRRTTEESARVVHAVRMARRVVRDRGAVVKLFDEIAPRFAGAPRRLHPHREARPAPGRCGADVAARADARRGRPPPPRPPSPPRARAGRRPTRARPAKGRCQGRRQGREAGGQGVREAGRRGRQEARAPARPKSEE